MNRVALELAVAGAMIGVAGTASAQDMRFGTPVDVVRTNWTGVYVGGHGGSARQRANGTSDFLDPAAAPPGDANSQANKLNSTAALAGVHAGFNWQVTNYLLLGIEGDATWTKTSYEFCRQTDTGSAPCFDNDNGFETIKSQLEWLATIRGRLGVTFGNFLFYGTGGVARGSIKTDLAQTCNRLGCGSTSLVPVYAADSFRDTKSGWVAGGGVEAIITPNWIVRAEYLHVDLGTVTNTFSTEGSGGNLQSTSWSRKETFDMVRAGVSYKFNPGMANTRGNAQGVPSGTPVDVVRANWTGLYVGGHGGWGRQRGSGTSDFLDLDAAPPGDANPQANTLDSSSVLAGVHAGFNWQVTNYLLLGIEGDATWTKTSYEFCRQTDTGSAPCVDNDNGFETIKSQLEWLATIRGRLGVTFGNVLLYGTGGVARAGIKTDLAQSCMSLGCGSTSLVPVFAAQSFRDAKTGWTAGGGVEAMITPHWIVRAEYLHVDLGTLTNTFSTEGSGGNLQTTSWSRKETFDMVRAGVSYKFN